MARTSLQTLSSRSGFRPGSLAIGLLLGCTAIGSVSAQTLPTTSCTSTAVLNTGPGWQFAVAPNTSYPATPPAWTDAVTTYRLDNADWRWIDAYAPAAQWIAANAAGNSPGTYTYYRYEFDLDSAVDPASFAISLTYHTDDRLDAIYVNGQAQSVPAAIGWDSSGGRPYLTQEHGPHSLASDWASGANEVLFVVWNAGGPSGLLTQGAVAPSCVTLAAAPTATAVPVPANGTVALTLLSAMLGGAAAAGLQRRRKRRQ